jgi:tetratricopeptide (TPR) repeat protein
MHKLLNRHLRYFILMFVFAALSANMAYAIDVRGELTSDADIAALPPVCKLILVQRKNIHMTVGQREHPEIFMRPEYNIAQGNPHLHHYCWALVEKLRYFRATNETKKAYYLDQFMSDIDYVIQNSRNDWRYFDVMYLEQANMLFVIGEYDQALLKVQDALKKNQQNANAYALLSDIYNAKNNKKEAIAVLQDGLNYSPYSALLRKKMEDSGATPPPLPATDVEAGNSTDLSKTPVSSAAPKTSADDYDLERSETDSASDISNQVDEKDSHSKRNPYCRFCP